MVTQMLKVQNNSATREAVPSFLIGLKPESLLDLSWTDPALGVQDCAWWPEEDISKPLVGFEVYGTETLTLDAARKVVLVDRAIEPMPQDQVDAITAAKAKEVRAERNALLTASDWTQVADAPVDAAAWATYRQALRDITDQAGFPHSVVWPAKPE
jgi:hypothetical protein